MPDSDQKDVEEITLLPPRYVGAMTADQRERVVEILSELLLSHWERETAGLKSPQEDRLSENLQSGYNGHMDTKVIQMRARGTLTLPAGIRERYGLSDGDPVTVVDLDGTLVLSPKIGLVPKLASEIEKLRKERGVSLEDLVSGVAEERARRRKG